MRKDDPNIDEGNNDEQAPSEAASRTDSADEPARRSDADPDREAPRTEAHGTEAHEPDAIGSSARETNVRLADEPKPIDAKALAQRAIEPLLKIAGSSALIAGVLLFFGFLSQNALYAFAGLPRLSMDYIAMLESGATGIVDTISLMMGSVLRVVLLTLFFVAFLGFWLLRDTPLLKRLARSHWLFLGAQLFCLVLVLSLLSTQVRIAEQGSPSRRAEVEQQVRAKLSSTRMDHDWSPTREHEMLWAETYRLSGAWSVLNPLAQKKARQDSNWQSDRLGQPLRMSPTASRVAADLFGWLGLATLGVFAFAIGLRLWRAWLTSAAPSAAGTSSWIPLPDHVLTTSRRLLEPLVGILALATVGLLPIAHGIMARPGIGHEQVIVRLKRTSACVPELATTIANRDPDHADAPGTIAPAGSVLLAGDAPCNQGQLETLQEPLRIYSQALLDVAQSRPGENANERVSRDFRSAVDLVLEGALELGCVGALQRVWQMRPHPAVYARNPLEAQYFWDRWQEMQVKSTHLRFGTILQYPRGQLGNEILLVERIADQTPLRRGRWALRGIQRDCIEETIVVPSLVDDHVDLIQRTVAEAPDTRMISDLGLYFHPASFRAGVNMLEADVLPSNARGFIISIVGTLAGVFETYEPIYFERAVAYFAKVLTDPEEAYGHRRAAATALRLAGGPHAGQALQDAIEDVGLDVVANRLNESISSAGFLLSDIMRMRRGANLAEPAPHHEALESRLIATLRHYAVTPTISDENRSATCTALELLGTHEAASSIAIDALRVSIENRGAISVRTCLSPLRFARVDEASLLTGQIVRGEIGDDWPPTSVREYALMILFAIGLDQEAETVFSAFTEPAPGLARRAAVYIEDVESGDMGELLLSCAENEHDPYLRARCLHGMLILEDDEDGDSGFAKRIETFVSRTDIDPMLAERGCRVLHEFKARSGFVAEFAIDRGVCNHYDKDIPPGDQPARWRQYLRDADELLNGTAEIEAPPFDYQSVPIMSGS